MTTTPLAIASLGLAALLSAGCGVGEARLESELVPRLAAPLPVRTTPVDVSDLFARYQATSSITADGDAQVPARIAGVVIETLVEEGDPVVQGQLLARIDGERLRLRLDRSTALLEQKRAEFRRQQQLNERGLVSRAAFEGLQYEVEELRAAYRIDRLNYSYSGIRAPIGGVVAARHIRTGQHVGSGDLAFRISDTSRLVARLLLPQRELARFRPGQEATLVVDAYAGRQFRAVVERVSPTVDSATGTFRATAYIDNADGALAPGMFGRFDIQYQAHPQSLNVPVASIADEDGETVVYCIENGQALRRPVTVGIVDGDRAQIVSGLGRDDTIIVSGAGGLRHGTPVVDEENPAVAAGA